MENLEVFVGSSVAVARRPVEEDDYLYICTNPPSPKLFEQDGDYIVRKYADGRIYTITVRSGGLLTDVSMEERDGLFWMRGRPYRSFARLLQYFTSIREPICPYNNARLLRCVSKQSA